MSGYFKPLLLKRAFSCYRAMNSHAGALSQNPSENTKKYFKEDHDIAKSFLEPKSDTKEIKNQQAMLKEVGLTTYDFEKLIKRSDIIAFFEEKYSRSFFRRDELPLGLQYLVFFIARQEKIHYYEEITPVDCLEILKKILDLYASHFPPSKTLPFWFLRIYDQCIGVYNMSLNEEGDFQKSLTSLFKTVFQQYKKGFVLPLKSSFFNSYDKYLTFSGAKLVYKSGVQNLSPRIVQKNSAKNCGGSSTVIYKNLDNADLFHVHNLSSSLSVLSTNTEVYLKNVKQRSDFSSLNMTNANFEKSEFEQDKNFSRSSLNFANFSQTSSLKNDYFESDTKSESYWKTDFSQASLFRSDFSYATLGKANFERTNMHGSQLEFSVLCNANFNSSRLSNTIFYGAFLKEAQFQKANLRNANLQMADLSEANLKGANLYGAKLRGANLTAVKIDRHTKFSREYSVLSYFLYHISLANELIEMNNRIYNLNSKQQIFSPTKTYFNTLTEIKNWWDHESENLQKREQRLEEVLKEISLMEKDLQEKRKLMAKSAQDILENKKSLTFSKRDVKNFFREYLKDEEFVDLVVCPVEDSTISYLPSSRTSVDPFSSPPLPTSFAKSFSRESKPDISLPSSLES